MSLEQHNSEPFWSVFCSLGCREVSHLIAVCVTFVAPDSSARLTGFLCQGILTIIPMTKRQCLDYPTATACVTLDTPCRSEQKLR